MLRTMNENVVIANNAFVINESALRSLVTSGKFYDLSARETLYSVSNRRQLVAAMFAAENRGSLTYKQNVTLQKVTKGYAVEAVMLAADRILSGTAQVVETVVDEVAELKAQLAAMQCELKDRECDIQDLIEEKSHLVSSLRLSVKGVVTNAIKQIVGI